MPGFTSAAELALAKRKHAADMGSVRRSRTALVIGDGGVCAGVVPPAGEAYTPSPKRTSAVELRAEKMHHRASIESPPRCFVETKAVLPTNSCEEIREQKVKHRRPLPQERQGVVVGDEDETPSPGEATKLVSLRQLNKEKKHHRHTVGRPEGPEEKTTYRIQDGPQGSQRQLERLKRNHDHGLQGDFGGFSPQRDGSLVVVTEEIDPKVAVKSYNHLMAQKKHHVKDMSVAKTTGPSKFTSNEEYTYDKKRHRHTVDVASPNGASPNPISKTTEGETEDGKCTSNRRMARTKQLHSHKMDVHRAGYSGSPQPVDESAKAKSNLEMHSSIARHKHEIDGGSPQKERVAVDDSKSNISLARKIRVNKHGIDGQPTSARVDIFESQPPPVLAAEGAEA